MDRIIKRLGALCLGLGVLLLPALGFSAEDRRGSGPEGRALNEKRGAVRELTKEGVSRDYTTPATWNPNWNGPEGHKEVGSSGPSFFESKPDDGKKKPDRRFRKEMKRSDR